MRTLVHHDINGQVFNPPEPGCVLCLTGLPGGGSKLYDRSPYGNLGTITGATWQRLPSGLWYLDFDGSDDGINCGNPASLQLSTITWELWVKPKAQTANNTYKGLLTKGASYYHGLHIYYQNDNPTYIWLCVDDTTDTYAGINYRWPSPTARWWYVVGIADTTRMELFVNAVSVGSATGSYQPTADSCSVGIGGVGGGSARNCACCIALPRIHNRLLSKFEIQRHFAEEKHLFGVW